MGSPYCYAVFRKKNYRIYSARYCADYGYGGTATPVAIRSEAEHMAVKVFLQGYLDENSESSSILPLITNIQVVKILNFYENTFAWFVEL